MTTPNGADQLDPLGPTERAVLGSRTPADVWALFSAYTLDRLGSAITRVRFRAGRIDVVWGVELDDGRAVAVKAHRPPVESGPLIAARDAKRALRTAGFPCADPLSGPDEVDGQIISVETLLSGGAVPDGREPDVRRLLAAGLAQIVDLLRGRPDLSSRTGRGPSWCRYQDGPWPTPHDTIVDFRATPAGFEWLDEHARRSTAQILRHHDDPLVVGHADWYAGNVTVANGALVGTFDWELVTDTEPVIAGFAAACFAASASVGGGMSTPEDVAAFMIDYDAARGRPLTESQQRAAAGAAAWILAFNARWQLALIEQLPGHVDNGTLALVTDRHEDYLALRW